MYDGKLHYSQVPQEFSSGALIAYLEFLAVVHAGAEYGHLWTGTIVRHGLDNSSCVYLGGRPRSDHELLQGLCEQHIALCERHAYRATFAHVARRFNRLADLLTKYICWQEFNAELPPGVRITQESKDSPCACRTASPVGNGVVYFVKLECLWPAA